MLDPLVTTVTQIVGAAIKPLVSESAIGLIVQGVLKPVEAILDPVLALLTNVLSLKVNVQEKPGNFLNSNGDDSRSFTERAVSVRLLPGVKGGESVLTLNLGNATVIGEPKSYTTTLTASPNPVEPGGSVKLSGEGFEPEEDVTITLPGGGTATAKADTEGKFTHDWAVPAGQAVGEVAFSATGATSATPADATTTVGLGDYTTTLTADPSTVKMGDTATLTGAGFKANELVTLTLPDGSTTQLTASGTGGISYPWISNQLGTANFKAEGEQSRKPAVAAVAVEKVYTPTVTVSPNPAEPGDKVDVNGAGYEPGETVTVTFPDGKTAEVTAGNDGTWTTPWTVPANQAEDTLTFKGEGAVSKHPATGTLDVELGTYATTLTANPATVTAGEASKLTAEGFKPGENVTLTIGSDTVETKVAGVDGKVEFDWTSTAAGTVDFTATGEQSRTPANASVVVKKAYTTKVTVSPNPVEPGNDVTVSGEGYEPGEDVTVTFPDGTNATIKADDDGKFSTDWTVPAGQEEGTLTFTGEGAVSKKPATGTTEVELGNYTTTLKAAPATVKLGETSTLTGGGFKSGEQVTLTLPDGSEATLTAGSDGSFTYEWISNQLGAADFTATGEQSRKPATASVTVEKVYAPTVTVSPNPAEPGQEVDVNGAGYEPNETVTVTFPNGDTAEVTAGNDGTWTSKWTVPANQAEDTLTFKGEGAVSKTPAEGTVDVKVGNYTTSLTANPATVTAGEASKLTAEGFKPGENVTLTIGSDTVETKAAGQDGKVEFDWTSTDAGTVNFTATGEQSRTPANASVVVEKAYNTSLNVQDNPAYPGGSATFTGEGFEPGESVAVVFGDPANTITVTADSDGKVSGSWPVPAGQAAGQVTVTATGAVSKKDATDTLTVNALPSFELSPAQGPAGATVAVEGENFEPNSEVTITIGGVEAGKVTADADGKVTGQTVTVPSGADVTGGAVANDGTRPAAEAPFTVTTPTVAVAPGEGVVGDKVTLTLSGYAPGSTVNLTFGGVALSPVTVDASGNATIADVVVPELAAGQVEIVGTDAANGNITGSTSFTVTEAPVVAVPAITINPGTGKPGDSATVTLSGYPAGAEVIVTIGGEPFGAVTVDGEGKGTLTGVVPTLAAGDVKVVGTAGAATAETDFTVTEEPATAEATADQNAAAAADQDAEKDANVNAAASASASANADGNENAVAEAAAQVAALADASSTASAAKDANAAAAAQAAAVADVDADASAAASTDADSAAAASAQAAAKADATAQANAEASAAKDAAASVNADSAAASAAEASANADSSAAASSEATATANAAKDADANAAEADKDANVNAAASASASANADGNENAVAQAAAQAAALADASSTASAAKDANAGAAAQAAAVADVDADASAAASTDADSAAAASAQAAAKADATAQANAEASAAKDAAASVNADSAAASAAEASANADSSAAASSEATATANAAKDADANAAEADKDANVNAAASASASANADGNENAVAQAAAQAAALADASSTASAAKDANAGAAAQAAAVADVDADASAAASTDADSAAAASAQAAAKADASSTSNANASADKDAAASAEKDSSAASAAQASANADASAAASSEATATANAAKDADANAAEAESNAAADPSAAAEKDAETEADKDANVNAAASASASANADGNENAVAQAAAQAAALADASSTASAAKDANAAAAAQAAAVADVNAEASATASTDADSAAAASAQAAAKADATAQANAEASASKDAAASVNADSAAASAAEASANADASGAASSEATATANAAAAASGSEADNNAAADPSAAADQDAAEDATANAEATANADATAEATAEANASATANAEATANADATANANADADAEATANADATANANAEADAEGQPSNEPKSTVKFKTLERGAKATQLVTGTGFLAGESVDATVNSKPIKLKAATADKNGKVTFTFAVGSTFELGTHHVALVGAKSGAVTKANDTTEFTVTEPLIVGGVSQERPPTVDKDANSNANGSASNADSSSTANAQGNANNAGNGDNPLANSGAPAGLLLGAGIALLLLLAGLTLVVVRKRRKA